MPLTASSLFCLFSAHASAPGALASLHPACLELTALSMSNASTGVLKWLWCCMGRKPFKPSRPHLSCPPFHLLTFLTLQGGRGSGCQWEAEVEPAESRLRALCRHKGFHPEGSVFPLGNWGVGTLALRLISYHNKGCSGTLLESGAVVGHSRAVSWAREERTSLWSEHHVFRPSRDKEALR